MTIFRKNLTEKQRSPPNSWNIAFMGLKRRDCTVQTHFFVTHFRLLKIFFKGGQKAVTVSHTNSFPIKMMSTPYPVQHSNCVHLWIEGYVSPCINRVYSNPFFKKHNFMEERKVPQVPLPAQSFFFKISGGLRGCRTFSLSLLFFADPHFFALVLSPCSNCEFQMDH